MKATYIQNGENLDYRNTSDTIIKAGDVVLFGSRIGIAGTNIQPEELGSLHMVGVFRIPKKAGEQITAGSNLYYSVNGLTAVSGEAEAGAIGYAVLAAEADDSHVTVKLMG